MMFWRLLGSLLWAGRGRLFVALAAVGSGGAVVAALLNLQADADRKLTREMRRLGANLIVSPPRRDDADPRGPALIDDAALRVLEAQRTGTVLAAAPFLYIAARAGEAPDSRPVVVTGTRLGEWRGLAPWWTFEGPWNGGDLGDRCLVGRDAAAVLGLAPGQRVTIGLGDRSRTLEVAAILSAGGAEDAQILVDLDVAGDLYGRPGRAALVQMSVAGSPEAVQSYADRLSAALPGLEVRPIRQIREAERGILERLRLLVGSMVALILVLTALSVLATTTALAAERRTDVGLMKALGGSTPRVVRLFLAEVGLLGLLGGSSGWLAGVWLSGWIGRGIFAAPIAARPEVLPLTIALMVGAALLGALPLRLLGRIRPAAILRGE